MTVIFDRLYHLTFQDLVPKSLMKELFFFFVSMDNIASYPETRISRVQAQLSQKRQNHGLESRKNLFSLRLCVTSFISHLVCFVVQLKSRTESSVQSPPVHMLILRVKAS